MRRKKQVLTATLCAFSMAINSAAVFAQDKDKKQDPGSAADQAPAAVVHALPAPPNRFSFIQSEFSFGGPVVKGAPYSAEAVTETIQTLGDGNRIIQNSSSKIYRDSEGRTRREQALKAIGPWAVTGETPVMITIDDPVTGDHYSLNSNTKTAHKLPRPMLVSDEIREKVKDLTLKSGNAAVAGVGGYSASGFGTVTSVGSATVASETSSSGSTTARVTITRRSPDTVVGTIAPRVAMAAPPVAFSWYGEGEVNTESLGNQVIEGVLAEGQRVTVTIEAGKIGNERPIVTVNERWYSPELQTVVFSKNSDPRMGETTYKLINIDRSEPDPSLFQIPADFTVEEGPTIRNLPMPAELPAIQKRRRPNED